MSDPRGAGSGAATGTGHVRSRRQAQALAGSIVILLYAFVALYLVPVFPHGASANEQTRWATAASIVDRGAFEISWTEPLFGMNPDTARVGERLYSNKAPGAAILAVPAYAAVRAAVGPPTASNVRASWTAMRWLIATLPLLGLAAYFRARRSSALGLALALFATPLFVYSLLLFSHVLAGVAVFFAYVLLFGLAGRAPSLARDQAPDPGKRAGTILAPPWSLLLAGLLAAIAVSAEFAVVVPVLVLGAGLLLQAGRPVAERLRAALLFGLGGLPCALLLALYNKALFGSFFSLSYAHEAFQEWADVAQRGVFGISVPTPANLWLLLLSPKRGLFFMAPVLALGAFELFRRAGGGSVFRAGGGAGELLRRRVRLAIVAASVLVLAGHGAAHGGWAAGPRYLVFVIPFLVEALLESPLLASFSTRSAFPIDGPFPLSDPKGAPRASQQDSSPGNGRLWLVGLLGGASVVLAVLPALTFPFAPPEFRFPHASFWRPLLADGWAAPTLGALVGLGSGPLALLPALLAILGAFVVSLAPLDRSDAPKTEGDDAPGRGGRRSENAPGERRDGGGRPAGPREDAGRLAIGVRTGAGAGRALGVLAGALVAGAALAALSTIAPGLDEPDGAARRAAIEERFFRPEGRIAAVRARTTDPAQLRYLDLMDWQVAEVAALAPDNWPYSRQPLALERPGEIQRHATELSQQKKLDDAEAQLRKARETFAFARCDFTDDLSVVLYLQGRKDQAIAELESVRTFTRSRTSPGCRKSLFHLGSLYLEMGRPQEASEVLREYLTLTEGYRDAETVRNRQAAAAALSSVQR